MNKVFLIGNLTKDPDVRTTGSGTSVCTFRIAVQRRFANQQGERASDFFDVVAWRQLADLCGRYLAKGRKVAVVGELQNRSYDAKDGTKRYVTEVVADEVEFLTPRDRTAPVTAALPPLRNPTAAAKARRLPPKALPTWTTTICLSKQTVRRDAIITERSVIMEERKMRPRGRARAAARFAVSAWISLTISIIRTPQGFASTSPSAARSCPAG